MNANCESTAYRSLIYLLTKVWGVRKVTIGITGLWLPRVHIDAAFWSFDVGSS